MPVTSEIQSMKRVISAKKIYWRTAPNKPGEPWLNDAGDKQFFNAHILVGYCSESLESYKTLAEILRETFPDATDDEIECGRVTKSSYCQGHTLLRYSGYAKPGTKFKGWTECENMDYYF